MDEIFEITEFVQEETGFGTDLIWGNCYDEELGEKISVTVIATGFEHREKNTAQKGKDSKVVVSLDDDKGQPPAEQPPKKKSGLADIGFEPSEEQGENTFEFDDVPKTLDKNRKRYTYDDPYAKEGEAEPTPEERQKWAEKERRRRERLRSNRVKLSNPQTVIELENEPAYLRRGVSLDDVPDAGEESRSKWTISDDDEAEFRSSGNSYLHDNVD